MKCLVTGGAGFIGSNLVDKLIKDGHAVVIVDDLSTGKKENINSKAEFHKVNICSRIAYDKTQKGWPSNNWNVFEGVDIVFHTAAKARVQPSIENPIEYHEVNVNGTLNMLRVCIDNGIKRFIYSASSSVYGNTNKLPQLETDPTNPLSPYGVQKLIGEMYCKMFSHVYGLETVSLRYFSVYGERQLSEGAYCLVMGIFVQQRLNGELMTINGDGNQRRDFTYVGDVVNANILAATSNNVGKGEVINIGNGENRSVNQLATLIGGKRIHKESVKEPFATLADNQKAKDLLGWKPTMKLEDWIKKYKKDSGI